MANTGWANMCLVVTVAGEIADAEPELRQVAAEVIASWVEEGSRYLAGRGLSQADARAAMYALLAALEGGFLLARAQRDAAPLSPRAAPCRLTSPRCPSPRRLEALRVPAEWEHGRRVCLVRAGGG